jgi:DNA-binding NarL/FixJ family response regulator
MTMSAIRVMIVDDHKLVREGLKAVFGLGEEIDVVGEAGSGEDALDMIARVDPDVILMDISMPGMNGIQATKQIRKEYPDVKIVILTMLDQEGSVYEAVKAGATGYMIKSTSSDELVRAIEAVNDGKALQHPDATAQLNKEFESLSENRAKDYGLSDREMEVLQLLSEGKTNKELAKALWISEQTVKTHLAHIFGKLGTSDRTETVAHALRSGLVI